MVHTVGYWRCHDHSMTQSEVVVFDRVIRATLLARLRVVCTTVISE